MRRIALACSFALFAVACANNPSADPAPRRVQRASSAIYHGTLDTTHQGIAALESKVVGGQYYDCTGSIIKVDVATGLGYMLTAAHCVNDAMFPPATVIIGNNSASGKKYKVTNFAKHPNYNANTQVYDFGMVTFSGADATTPVYPVLTKANDTLAKGSDVLFVGYGVTDTNQNNTLRYQVGGTLDSVTNLTVHYLQTAGGPCEGDSGGPAFVTIGGVEYVAAVTSYGDQACVQFGVSGRVSAVNDWIDMYTGGGTGAGGSTGAGGTTGAGGSSAGGLCATKATWNCDAVSPTALCGMAGSTCDIEQNGGFACFDPPPANDVKIGGACDNGKGPYCAQGGRCEAGVCVRYCCADSDCAAGEGCVQVDASTGTDVGTCHPGAGTGAGGSGTGAGGSAGGTGTGTGGASTGTGGSASSAGGAATGTGGAATGTGGGSTAAGAGGVTTGTGLGGTAAAGATGTGTGAGAAAGSDDGSAPASGSSGGCSTSGGSPTGGSFAALLGLAGLFAARRRRSK
jgi:MYXO-CTERM domain-containing protein